MASQTELVADIAETLFGSVDEGLHEKLMAFANNDDVESIFATLQEPFEDMECRIVVSTMVQEAVSKGFLRAIEEESSIQLAAKDTELRQLRNGLKEKDAAIFDLKKVLEMREREFLPLCPDDRVESSKQVWEFLHESQQKWRDSEARIEEKESELTKLAISMTEMASILDNESRRAASLEKQLKDMREQEATKTTMISTLHEEINRLKVAHRSSYSRLKREARLKELKFNESMEQLQAERQKQNIELGRLLTEKEDMGRLHEEKRMAIFSLDNDLAEMSQTNHGLETKTRAMIKELNRLSMVEQNSFILEEQIERQKFIHEAEGEILAMILEQRVVEISAELARWAEKNQTSNYQHETLDHKFPSVYSNDDATALSNDILRIADDVKQKSQGRDVSELADVINESCWKHEVEAMLVLIIVEGWNKEVINEFDKLNLKLALESEEICNRDREVAILKQAMEEFGNDYAHLLEILRWDNSSIRDEASAELMPELACERRLIELGEHLKVIAVPHGQNEDAYLRLRLEEDLAGQQLQHDVELDILSEIFKHKYQETIDMALDSKFGTEKGIFQAADKSYLPSICDALKINEVKEGSREESESSTKSLEELEAQLESFLELEASRLERIKSGCSTSIAKCEFRLDNLMESLANQVNDMKTKISFVQEAIKQQEWKHNVEDEILVVVLLEAVRETHRKFELAETTLRSQPMHMNPSERYPSIGYDRSLDEQATSKSLGKAVGCCIESGDEHCEINPSKRMDLLGLQDNDKMIYFLKRKIEELRKEKAELGHKLDQRTEELYSLKRQFWKEKEIWVSKLSQPQRKEVEILLRQYSASIEEEFQKLEAVFSDSVTSKLRGEWQTERTALLEAMSQKESDMKRMAAELARADEKEKSSTTARARLVAHNAELEMEKVSLSKERLNQESLSFRWKQDWQREKDRIEEELAKLVEKEKGHVDKAAHLVASITEVEKEREALIREKLDQESLSLRCRKEWQTEKECLLKRIQESEKANEEALSKLAVLSEKEKGHVTRIAQLESEKDWLIAGQSRESSATSLLEEREIALALAIKEREEEEKRRKVMEVQLQGLRLELKSLHGLNEERETLIREKLDLKSSSLRCRKEWQTEKECLLERIQKSEEVTEEALSKLAVLSEKEKHHVTRVAQLESEKDRLITGQHRESSATLLEEREIALALAVKEREEEEKRRKIIEIQLQGLRLELKSLQGLNDEVTCLREKLDSIPRQLELKVAEQITEFSKVYQEFEYRVTNKIQERIGSLDGIKEKCLSFKGNCKSSFTRESHYKQKLIKELSNLQKAETEVDLLGEEVDSLINVLEKVYVVFDHYAPVLQHYPRMTDLAKLVKQEIQLRIDPKYGL